MTDSNMPTDKSGGEKYLRARKVQALETLTFINSGNDKTVEDIATELWEKVAEIDEQLGESTGE